MPTVKVLPTVGGIPAFINDDYDLYEGNMVHYYRVVSNARNVMNPYHNIRHMLHVGFMCYSALYFYREIGKPIEKRDSRNLMIKGLMHDYDHRGMTKHDDLNIELAVRGLKEVIPNEDKFWLGEISLGISRATQFPYIYPAGDLSLPDQILRDADMTQVFSTAWIHQVIYGLSVEMGKTPLEVLKFNTEWALYTFGDKDQIEEKIVEARELLAFYE